MNDTAPTRGGACAERANALVSVELAARMAATSVRVVREAKGKRVQYLEESVIDAVALRAGSSRWTVFGPLDDCFVRVAARGDDRLARSRP